MGTLYAEGTKVTVDQSRAEITAILAKHGVTTMAWGSRPSGDMLQFELEGRAYRLKIERPTMEQVRHLYRHMYAPQVDWDRKLAQEWQRRWRANVLLLKAKLEFADGVTSTPVRELTPYLVTAGGQTLEEIIEAGGVALLGTGS